MAHVRAATPLLSQISTAPAALREASVRKRQLLPLFGIAALIFCFSVGSLPVRAAGTCIAPPSGLVSWWSFDSDESDLMGQNNAAQVSGVSLVPAEVSNGFSLAKGTGYI